MKKYKVLFENLQSPFQGFQFRMGKKYHCKDFDENPKIECSRGFYATDVEGLPYSFNTNMVVYECEVWGKQVIINPYKQRFENIELIKKIPHSEIKKLAKKEEKRLGYILSEILFPVNPLLIKREKKVSKEEIGWLEKWIKVENLAEDSIRDSVGNSIGDGDSIGDSVWNSVSRTIQGLERSSVWAYVSSLFPNIKEWKYFEGIQNPFDSGVKLWKAGLVLSLDRTTWRLHCGVNAEIVYEKKLNK